MLKEAAVEEYITGTVRLAWRMANQNPPMCFLFARKKAQIWYEVEGTNEFEYLPGLMYGEKVMTEGKVM